MTENQPEPTKPPYGPSLAEEWVKDQIAKGPVPVGVQREPTVIEDYPRDDPEDPGWDNPLLDHIAEVFRRNLGTAAAKNHDYAGSEDPLANFRECERFGVSMSGGIMVRLSDKWSRLTNLFLTDPEVVGESLFDTIEDMQVYLGILHYVLTLEACEIQP